MIVLIGASGGIGKELSLLLKDLGKMIATYNETPLGFGIEGVEEIRLNLTSSDEIGRFGDYLSRVDEKITLINMAALSIDALAANLDHEDWKKAFDVNVHSAFLIIKKILPKMIGDEWGRLILTSSIVARKGPAGTSAYSSSKSALDGLCKTLAHEYGRFNITCNMLELGYFDKGLIHSLSEAKRQNILKNIPLGSFGHVRNIFEAIKFIIAADYLNGASIRLDGGCQ